MENGSVAASQRYLALAAGVLNLVLTAPKVGYPDTMRCVLLPMLLVLPPWLAAALLLYSLPPASDRPDTGDDT